MGIRADYIEDRISACAALLSPLLPAKAGQLKEAARKAGFSDVMYFRAIKRLDLKLSIGGAGKEWIYSMRVDDI